MYVNDLCLCNEMDIVVSDTNIFIDLISVGLMEASCRLPIKIHTVDYVMNEITDDIQKEVINKLADEGKITVKHFSPEEFMHIIEIYSSRSNNVSVTDCSVWYYAKQNSFRLLTGDNKLRNSVIADGVQVSGILFLTDMLVEQNIIDAICMADKLEELLAINIRLPKKMIDERIERYRTKR